MKAGRQQGRQAAHSSTTQPAPLSFHTLLFAVLLLPSRPGSPTPQLAPPPHHSAPILACSSRLSSASAAASPSLTEVLGMSPVISLQHWQTKQAASRVEGVATGAGG